MEYTATRLKADHFTFPVLELFSVDIDAIASEVAEVVDQAPKFFHNAPVVIDLKSLPDDEIIQFDDLLGVLRSLNLNPVAIRGGSSEHQDLAVDMQLAVLADEHKRGRRSKGVPDQDRDNDGDSAVDEQKAGGEATQAAESNETNDVLVEQESSPAALPEPEVYVSRIEVRPIRSGQKLSSPADLVVIASTSAGSELISGGNIHVYGALRGRALAGVTGDESCRIFCQRLEAELVSIAGFYRVSEDFDEALRGRPVQIFLENEQLKISPLTDAG
ncbi:MAG: putative septum site-determining protein MinC [marine bacterium B5-7]|nr:MAG: putative septum site-determining protein MinC [marine bacterium B5-7]